VPANPQALARCVQKGFAVEDLRRVFAPMSAEEFYKELVAVYGDIATLAVLVAKKALVALRAAGVVEAGADLTLEEMLSMVKQARAAAQEEPETSGDIDSIEKLSAVLSGDKQFERALGLVGEGDGLERSPSGSRKWRDPGRVAR
jgi:hypothetical protein